MEQNHTRLTVAQEEKWDSIVRVARYGLENGKHNMIVDLDILVAVGDALLKTQNELVIRRGLNEAI